MGRVQPDAFESPRNDRADRCGRGKAAERRSHADEDLSRYSFAIQGAEAVGPDDIYDVDADVFAPCKLLSGWPKNVSRFLVN